MREDIVFILEDIYGETMLNAIAADAIDQLYKKAGCKIPDEDLKEFEEGDRVINTEPIEFKQGDRIISIRTGQKGVVGRNLDDVLGFIINGEFLSIMTKGIRKYYGT